MFKTYTLVTRNFKQNHMKKHGTLLIKLGWIVQYLVYVSLYIHEIMVGPYVLRYLGSTTLYKN